MNVKFMVAPNNVLAHQELVAALGSENNPKQWMDFMDAMDKHIPEMTSKGRLSKTTIDKSLIGKLGFKSFKEMVEAPIEAYGLNWSIGGWNSYRRAWSVVKEYPFLRQEQLKAGWINALVNECRNNGIDFPINKTEFLELKEKRKNIADEKRTNKIKEMESLIEELNSTINEYKKETTRLKLEVRDHQSKQNQLLEDHQKLIDNLSSSQESLGFLKSEKEHLTSEITTLKQKKKALSQAPKRLISRSEALKILFLGDDN